MVVNIVNLLSRAFSGANVQSTNTSLTRISDNPFASPFVSAETGANSYSKNYGQNKPVQGGYFAGYYNGRANIVGQRLFIEA